MRQLIKRHIGQILLDCRFLSNHDLDRALEEQKYTKELLGQVLVRMGVLKERDFRVPLIMQGHLSDIDGAVKIAAGERQLLGVLLVHSGRITNEQLDHAISEQKRSGERLGEVFIRLGMLTERQLTALLDFQKNQLGATSGPLRLGELLIATGYISREQLDEALRKQTLSHKKLGEVLIDEGYVRPSLVKYGICLQKMVLGSVLAAILSLGMNATSYASSAKFQWEANTESDLAGYRLHYGIKGEAATQHLDIDKLATTATINGLDPDKSYDFTITAYNTSDLESVPSHVETVFESVPPTVSIYNPLNNAKVGNTVLVQANASDNVGVEKVEFYVNDILMPSEPSEPYRFSWNTKELTPGQYNITAKAYDAAGNVGVSSVSVTVFNDVTPPTVSHAAPAQGSSLSGAVTVSCDASDDVGVTMVEFYVNGAMVSAGNTAPYNYVWDTTKVANGSYTLTTKAYDAAGNAGISTVSLTVFNDVTPPTVSHIAPAQGGSLSGVATVSCTASDDVGVAMVEFYVNNVKVTTVNTAPYNYVWDTTKIANGSYNITTKAYDAAGNVGVSTVTLTVFNDVTPPTVSLATPAQGSPLKGVVTVSSNASDDVGVAMVEFYVNGAKVATVNAAPYNYVWDTTKVANGSYTLTTKAYDAAGNTSQAGNLLVSVLNAAPPAPLEISNALQALQIAIGLLTPTDAQKTQLDVAPYINGQSVPDGNIEVGDALTILLKITGKI